MAAEHCSLGGCDYEFTYTHFTTTTTPRKEWLHVVSVDDGLQMGCPPSNMNNGRRLLAIDECLQKPTAKRAGLNRAEIIALVMFTGPMVRPHIRGASRISAAASAVTRFICDFCARRFRSTIQYCVGFPRSSTISLSK